MKELSCGRRSAPGGSPAEFRQTVRGLLLCRPSFAAANQGHTQNFPVLGLGGPAVLRRTHSQATDDILIQVANRESRHFQPLMLSNAAMTAPAGLVSILVWWDD
ncbi:MAG TPA: hypothetical protein VJY39_03700 [Acidisphaera sp.]|nr:hypothetical protein [Acidisphaera sp.]